MDVKSWHVDQLQVELHPNRFAMGQAAATAVAEQINKLLKSQPAVRMIFAAAPSQNEFLASLIKIDGLDWSRIIAFHMDDYLGLPDDAPQRFSSYLKEHLFRRVTFQEIYYLLREASPLIQALPVKDLTEAIQAECDHYSGLLKQAPIDIVCMGIGENGHIAFNDPPVAEFNDPQWVKLVELEERCRMQQVNDGCFQSLEAVPTYALTLTIPALLGAKWLYCMVPGPTKRDAVRKTLTGPVSTACPATILRKHSGARLYLDPDAAAGLDFTNTERSER